MNLQKNIDILKNKKLTNNKKCQIFKFFFSSYSNCRPKYGDFDDKENIN